MVFFNKIRLPAQSSNPSLIEKGLSQSATLLKQLDHHLSDNKYLAGNEFTMGDIPLGAMLYRYFTMDIPRPELPMVERFYQLLCDRSAYEKHVMIPFGTNSDEWLIEEKRNAGIQ